MITDHVIEEHPSNEITPWVSCAVITPKTKEYNVFTWNSTYGWKSTFLKLAVPRPFDVKYLMSISLFSQKGVLTWKVVFKGGTHLGITILFQIVVFYNKGIKKET